MFEQFFSHPAWKPWQDLDRLQNEVNRLVSQNRLARRFSRDAYPPINIWSEKDKVLVWAEVPGVDPKSLDISTQNNTITIRGERRNENLKEGEGFHRQERPFGQFVRSFELPYRVDAEKVQAEYQKGLLKISLARHEEDKPRKINVKVS